MIKAGSGHDIAKKLRVQHQQILIYLNSLFEER